MFDSGGIWFPRAVSQRVALCEFASRGALLSRGFMLVTVATNEICLLMNRLEASQHPFAAPPAEAPPVTQEENGGASGK